MTTQEIRGYCSQCSCYCRIVSYVRDGVFVDVKPDKAHPLYSPICPKGKAGPELVYNSQRLQYPMRRTTPKGSPDPGWQRISWDEALDTITTKLNEIKAQYGAEAVATSRAGPGGSALSEIWPWLKRFAQAFGTPNNISTTHICQWHRDNCSAYTYGKPGVMGTHGRAEFERAGSILILGNNVPVTRLSMMPFIERGMKHGAKLVVIDTRKTDLAAKADLWLQVNPDTDTALFMSMLQVMLEDKLYDAAFARDWTTGPFLVRSDTGNLLKASDLTAGGNPAHYVVAGSDGNTNVYQPGAPLPIAPVLDTACAVKLAGGQQVECKTAFR
ncbi:MAG: molybdopterin-dependent oxidoreductase, partial [Chloroflexota bacterium]|nr:molybdopterin-dependent oxidoreductase [Chloroflexota bacterium]